ncbi:odorant receptor 9a-like, partial [Cardiocondyla obscurior]|uniref:odorant receptor 9a-like n=1 Tax=Cardiocondyla obscurior TaxID=286306 RepID=UPI0039655FFA
RQVKDLLAQLQHSRNKLMDKNEVAIFKKYDSISGRYTIGLTILGIFGILATVIAQIWLNLSNVDLSANKSRTNYFLFTMEYFIDQQKYYYLIMLHSHVAVYFGTILMVATGTMMIMYIHHTCGMFRVAKYRIEHAVNFNIRRNMIPNSAIFMAQGIICAVDMHRQAIKLNKNFMSVLEKMMFCLIACAVACLSLNMFQVSYLHIAYLCSETSFQLAFEKDVKKLVMPFTRTLVCVIYMYLANLMGQIVIDHNNQVFDTAYNVDWFKTPVHVQKMILFLLQRRSKEFALNVGGVYDASIQNFATLVKASVSYFTVICST